MLAGNWSKLSCSLSSQPSKSEEGEPGAACQLLVTCQPRSKCCPYLTRQETALGKADFARSEPSSTPRVTQAYQEEPELRDTTHQFATECLIHGLGLAPRASQCCCLHFPPHHPVPAHPWNGWTCTPNTPRWTALPPDLWLLKPSPVTDSSEEQETGLCSSTDTHSSHDPFDGGR